MNDRVPIAIVAAHRTPIGKFLGEFRELSARDLGVQVTRGLIEQVGIAPDAIDTLVYGCGRQAGGGPNIARQVQIGAGIPETGIAYTVNMACGSGLLAILEAARLIWLGEAKIVIAGGVESMTRLPYFLEGYRLGYAQADQQVVDGMTRDGFFCPMSQKLMGETAETLAERYEIARIEQDEFAVDSQSKAGAAWAAGRFAAEIIPVETPEGLVSVDGHPRPGTTLEKVAKLPAVFKKNGTVSAGNASGITDGAASLLVMSLDEAERRGLAVLARLEHHAQAGVDPAVMGLGPVPATRKLFARADYDFAAIDLVELNEAFAAQVIACDRELAIPREKLNVNGGAIALGHPIGATGARIVVTLLHELARRGGRRGLATLCISGGLGLAATFVRD